MAGTGSAGFSGDGGLAAQAQLNAPTGVCVDTSGNVYVNDLSNLRVRKISPQGTISTVAGSGIKGYSGDGGLATTTSFSIPIRCATDSGGNLFIVDQGAHRVLKLDSAGKVSTIAGNGAQGFSGDGGAATTAALNNPTAIAFGPTGDLYITDQVNQRIRRVDASGVIQTVAGNGATASAGDGGPATSASFNFPGSIAIDAAGNVFVVDTVANRLRKISGGVINTVAGTGAQGSGGDGGPALQAMFSNAFGIAIDRGGTIYIGDTNNYRIRKITGLVTTGGPILTSAGVTNGASFQTGVAPGGIVTIFGTSLGAPAGQVVAAWGASLGGVSVAFDGVPAPVYRVLNLNGQEQLSVQAPFSLFGKNSTSIVVTTASGSSAAVNVPVLAAQPGIFLLDAANDGAVHANGTIATAARPAVRGETVVLYLTGLGTVGNQPVSGQPASLTTLSTTVVTPQVSMGGSNALVVFSGLTPGYIGLYQINAVVPALVPSGSVDVSVTANGVVSNTAKIAVQ